MMAFIKKWILHIILALGLIGVLVYAAVLHSSHAKSLVDFDETIAAMKLELAQKEANVGSGDSDIVLKTTGLDYKRVQTDTAAVDQIFEKLLNWNGYAEYTQVRDSLQKDYPDAFADTFFDVFFPAIKSYTDESGETYWRVKDYGAEANMSYAGKEAIYPYVMDIKDGVYSYLSEVNVTSSLADVSGTGVCMFVYKVDENGKVFDIQGYSVN